MSQESNEHKCQCQCGSTEFTAVGDPILRVICHCTICQEFNDAAYADISIFLSKDVELLNAETVSLQQYKAPPAVQRGKCIACSNPAIEFLELPLFPALTIIPTGTFPDEARLPGPVAHLFYHRRVSDIDDALPKYEGFMKSQFALTRKLLPGLFRRLIK
mgnify:CR=1 FL=1